MPTSPRTLTDGRGRSIQTILPIRYRTSRADVGIGPYAQERVMGTRKEDFYMKVSVKKKDAPKVLTIQTDLIKLEAALKYAALTATGGEAKEVILQGLVTVNGEVCTMRGKKLRTGDSFTFQGETYVISGNEPS